MAARWPEGGGCFSEAGLAPPGGQHLGLSAVVCWLWCWGAAGGVLAHFHGVNNPMPEFQLLSDIPGPGAGKGQHRWFSGVHLSARSPVVERGLLQGHLGPSLFVPIPHGRKPTTT